MKTEQVECTSIHPGGEIIPKLDFPRGYHIEIGGGFGMPSYGFGNNITEMNKYIDGVIGGYGDKLRDDVKKFYGAFIHLAGRGESIAQYENRCEIDPNVVDQFGIPVSTLQLPMDRL